jgi:membrane fusion protein (multidrug efflux system)
MENLRKKTTDRDSNLELVLSDGSVYNYKGAFDFIDRGIDPTTGAILIQASFPNPDGLIRPGQFAQIRVPISDDSGTIIVPQRSVMELQGKYQVYVVNDSNKVDLREVVCMSSKPFGQILLKIKREFFIIQVLKSQFICLPI